MVRVTTSNRKQNTRDIILQALKNSTQSTVDNLADAAQVSPVTVRHHLNTLQAEGLLESTSVRRKIGRPHLVYRLSEDGHELFPKKYARLSSRLLTELKEHFSRQVINDLFENVVAKIIAEHAGEFETLPFEDKLDFLVDLLGEEGFLARWEETDGKIHIIESSCPYISIGQGHEEVCAFDKGLITSILMTEIEQHSCMLVGDGCCQFTIVRPENIKTSEGI